MPIGLQTGIWLRDGRGPSGLTQAQVTLRPSAAGDVTEWLVFPSGANWEVAGDDDLNTEVYLDPGPGGTDLYQVQNLPGDAVAVVSVDVWIAAFDFGGSGSTFVRHHIKLGGVTADGPEHGPLPQVATTYTDLAVGRPGGGAWTVADVNAVQIGPKNEGVAAGRNCDVPEMYLVVTYLH